MRNFREFDIWKRSIQLAKNIYQLTEKLPNSEKYGLASQIQRAAVSIASNIAEGASRRSEVDFARFIEIALGSAFEVETQLLLMKELNYITESNYKSQLEDLNTLQKMMNKLLTKIRQ
ncbi:MAG: four helix bundle protein [Bacteroidales bacterium]|nr:four helix bundle protein [Bacteroidales bacterium]